MTKLKKGKRPSDWKLYYEQFPEYYKIKKHSH